MSMNPIPTIRFLRNLKRIFHVHFFLQLCILEDYPKEKNKDEAKLFSDVDKIKEFSDVTDILLERLGFSKIRKLFSVLWFRIGYSNQYLK